MSEEIPELEHGDEAPPIVAVAPPTPENAPRKRGRPTKEESEARSAKGATIHNFPPAKSSAEKQSRPAVRASVDILARRLVKFHEVIEVLSGSDALSITEDESRELVEAGLECLSHYKVKIDPKVAALLSLAASIGMIYGPRGVAFWMDRKEAEKNG